MIVEDEGDLLEVMQFILEDEGYRVSSAKRGTEALSIAASGNVDLVLLDISMPDIDGVEVARRLRADPVTAGVRIAIHTGLAANSIRRQFTDYDALITKTEDPAALVAAVKSVLQQPPRRPSESAGGQEPNGPPAQAPG